MGEKREKTQGSDTWTTMSFISLLRLAENDEEIYPAIKKERDRMDRERREFEKQGGDPYVDTSWGTITPVSLRLFQHIQANVKIYWDDFISTIMKDSPAAIPGKGEDEKRRYVEDWVHNCNHLVMTLGDGAERIEYIKEIPGDKQGGMLWLDHAAYKHIEELSGEDENQKTRSREYADYSRKSYGKENQYWFWLTETKDESVIPPNYTRISIAYAQLIRAIWIGVIRPDLLETIKRKKTCPAAAIPYSISDAFIRAGQSRAKVRNSRLVDRCGNDTGISLRYPAATDQSLRLMFDKLTPFQRVYLWPTMYQILADMLQQYQAGKMDYNKLAYHGGAEEFRRRLGVSANNATSHIKDTLRALHSVTYGSSTIEGGGLINWSLEAPGRGKQSMLYITVGPLLDKDAIFGAVFSPNRFITPVANQMILPKPIGGPRSHPPQAAAPQRLMMMFTDTADEYVEKDGVELTEERLSIIADETGVPRRGKGGDKMREVLENWVNPAEPQMDLIRKPFLEEISPRRYKLTEHHEGAEDLLRETGKKKITGKKRGDKRVARNKARRK